MFLHLKKHLAGKKFDDDDEVQEEVMTWFEGQAAHFYDSGIQKLVPRLNKCLDKPGDYVENKVMYRQFIHGVTFVNQKCCACLKPLYIYSPDMPRRSNITSGQAASYEILREKRETEKTLSQNFNVFLSKCGEGGHHCSISLSKHT